MSCKARKLKGFTLIEILVVVALIAILAVITIVAINPAKSFSDARDTTRSSHVSQILNAVTQYTSEEGHDISDFGTITDCTTGSDAIGTDVGNVDLTETGPAPLVDEYIVEIPVDPSSGTQVDTGYTICITSSGRVQIDAPNAENTTVSVKR